MTGTPAATVEPVARRLLVLPWCVLEAVAVGSGIVALHVVDDAPVVEVVGVLDGHAPDGPAPDGPVADDGAGGHLDELETQVGQYLAGTRRSFDVELDLTRLIGFRRAALDAARDVPFGSTVSYAELAERAGRPRAHRAAASACAHNPVMLVIPCHRVIHADGSLGGYGGRPELKRALLAHEGVHVAAP